MAWASATRITEADSLTSSDHTKTWTFPSTGGGFVISGAVPIAAQFQQDLFYGNGTSTSLTLSYSQVSSNGLVCYLDGLALIQGSGNDYTVAGSTVTLTSAPAAGQKVLCVYSRY